MRTPRHGHDASPEGVIPQAQISREEGLLRQNTQPANVRKRCECLRTGLREVTETVWGGWESRGPRRGRAASSRPAEFPSRIPKKFGEGICPNTMVPGQVRVKVIELSQPAGLTVWQTFGYIAGVIGEEIGNSGFRVRLLALGSCSLRVRREVSLRLFGRGLYPLSFFNPSNRAWRHYFVSTSAQGWRGRGELTGSWRNRPPQLHWIKRRAQESHVRPHAIPGGSHNRPASGHVLIQGDGAGRGG